MPPTVAGFARRYATDRYGRRVTYYVRAAGAGEPAPLFVYVQGSGCHSLFARGADGTVRARQQGLLAAAAGDGATVLAVEKPGVRYLDDAGRSGTADGCRPAFRREHTLERWAGAVTAAVAACRETAAPDEPVVLVGHSEGGIVAAAVARALPAVTHVAVLSGSGPTQLFDLLTALRADGRPVDELADAVRRLGERPDDWRGAEWAHPNRRWSSFLATSTLDELLASDAHTLIVHGVRDSVVPVAAARVLYTELLRHGRDVRLVERDAGHDLVRPRQQKRRALLEVFGLVVRWARDGTTA